MDAFYGRMGFAMSREDLFFCRDYFRDSEHRDPTVTELRVIDTYWSDHCRHTTFSTRLTDIEVEKSPVSAAIEEGSAPLLHGARRSVRPDGSSRLPDGYGCHRHEGAQAPAALCRISTRAMRSTPARSRYRSRSTAKPRIGWFSSRMKHTTTRRRLSRSAARRRALAARIRDPLSGRAYVYQAMRVTGSGDPRVPVEKTLHGKLPSRKITTGAAHGYSSYGNQIGLATGQVTELYDPGYVAKRLEIGAVIGASPKANVVRLEPAPGDVIVLLGGATGRDGIGGATGSSKAHTEKSVEVCGAEVQKGNPPTERKIQRLFRDPAVSTLIKRCNDFGAGGVSVANRRAGPRPGYRSR